MLIEERLQQVAIKSHRRQEKIQRWKLLPGWTNIAKYIYWRNRFPILTEVLTRSLLIFEVFLLSQIFNFFIATSFGLIILINNFYRNICNGLSVALKKEILANKGLLTSSNLYKIFVTNTILAAIAPALELVFLFNKSADISTMLFAAGWLIILPLQFTANSYWSIIYAFRRQHRKFWLIIAYRSIPTLYLFTIAKEFGLLSFIGIFILSRALEQIYLISIARRTLGILSPNPTAKQPKLSFKQLLTHNINQLLFPCGQYLQAMTLCLTLYIYLPNSWLEYFYLISLINILGYLLSRGPQSLSMDIFLSLKRRQFNHVKIWIHRANVIWVLCSIIGISSLLILAFATNLTKTNLILTFLPYLVLLTLLKTYWQNLTIYINSMFLEKKYLPLTSLFFLISLIQFYFAGFLAANLQMLLMIEIIGFAAILLFFHSSKISFDQSPIFQHRHSCKLEESNNIFLRLQKLCKSSNTYLLQLDSQYRNWETQELATSILIDSSSGTAKHLYLCPELLIFQATPEVHDKVIKELGFALRMSEQISFESGLISEIHRLYPKLIKSKGTSSSFRRFLSNIKYSFRYQIRDKLIDTSGTTNNFTDAEKLARLIENISGFRPEIIKIVQNHIDSFTSLPSSEQLKTAEQLSRLGHQKYLLIEVPKPFLALSNNQEDLFLIDTSGANSQQAQAVAAMVILLQIEF